MPAGITETDSMAYVGQQPWHGLGVKVEGDAMTAEEAIKVSLMDWKVDTVPVFVNVDGTYIPIEDKFATMRMDNNAVLGVVGQKYTPVQNIDCFKFFDAVTGTGDAKYDTVGTLNGGRRIWLLAKFNGGITLDSGDQIDPYMLLANSHDGGSALTMMFTYIRVVCQNTMEAALGKKDVRLPERFYARHTSSVLEKASQARDILQIQGEYNKRMEEQINLVADTAWTSHDMKRLAFTMFHLDPQKPLEEQHATKQIGAETVISLFNQGLGNHVETAWDAYNAITEWTSHYKGKGRGVNTVGSIDESVVDARLNYNWFNGGPAFRAKAWDILTATEDEKEAGLVPLMF